MKLYHNVLRMKSVSPSPTSTCILGDHYRHLCAKYDFSHEDCK